MRKSKTSRGHAGIILFLFLSNLRGGPLGEKCMLPSLRSADRKVHCPMDPAWTDRPEGPPGAAVDEYKRCLVHAFDYTE